MCSALHTIINWLEVQFCFGFEFPFDVVSDQCACGKQKTIRVMLEVRKERKRVILWKHKGEREREREYDPVIEPRTVILCPSHDRRRRTRKRMRNLMAKFFRWNIFLIDQIQTIQLVS